MNESQAAVRVVAAAKVVEVLQVQRVDVQEAVNHKDFAVVPLGSIREITRLILEVQELVSRVLEDAEL